MAGRGRVFGKVLLIIVVLGAIGGLVYWRISKEKADEEAQQAPEAATATDTDRAEAVEGLFRGLDPIPVKASPVVLGTLVQTVHAEGRAQPLRQVGVQSRVTGALNRILVKEGDFVRAGQVLAEIDDTNYRLDLQDAEAAYLRATADYTALLEERDTVTQQGLEVAQTTMTDAELAEVERRYNQALTDLQAGRITEDEFTLLELEYRTARILAGKERGNIMQASLTQSRIRREKAQRDLDNTRIKAPFSGRVADLEVFEGQYIGTGTTVLTLLDQSRMRVVVDVLESEIAPLRPDRRAEVRFTALPDQVFEGRVVSVNPMINSQTRTGKVELELDNPEGRITTGMFARARIFSRDIENVMMVPHESIVERDDRTLVFQVVESDDEERPDIVKWRYVDLGESNDTHVIVHPTDDPHAGVAPEMLVCVEGHVSLQHDSPVRLLEVVDANVLRP